MDRKILTIFCGIFILTFFSHVAYCLDAGTAHPWIAENAAKIWPLDAEGNCRPDSPPEACQEFSLFNQSTNDCKIKQTPDAKSYLGKFSEPKHGDSGGFTDTCPGIFNLDEFTPMNVSPDLTIRACTGKAIVEGSLEEDSNPFAGVVALGHSYNPDLPAGQNYWRPLDRISLQGKVGTVAFVAGFQSEWGQPLKYEL